jgi:hypothetical protein
MGTSPLNSVASLAHDFSSGVSGMSQLAQQMLQTAGQNALKGMADTAIQTAGKNLGLPQSVTDELTQAFNGSFDQSAAAGNNSGSSSSASSTSGSSGSAALSGLSNGSLGTILGDVGQLAGGVAGEALGGPLGEAVGQALGGDAGQAVGNLANQIQSQANQSNPNTQSDLNQAMTEALGAQGQQQSGGAKGGGGGKSWLEALAQAMGSALGNMAQKMVNESNQIQSLSGDSSSSGAQQFQAAMAQFQADSQMFGMLSNAFSNAIKTIGDGMSTMASNH